ncbi:uncharacterized protein CDV56_106392 [Aspergillus thermomutatus]|uniref:Uncharacterized protein n=1 Tax=Aspergillus thermomutatus TaxID=41047 RepID=A0A397GQS0_ASPTH|nr:uncharacterized protein CDV56_106392 [Aspergillus thermomutatus]RHZ51806.1 hypothetical protein CDV56_106392 [Aspergillus thermomutatus]
MASRGKKGLRPEDQQRLMDEYGISFDGPLLPCEWPIHHRENFAKVRQIKKETYDDYGRDGRLEHRLTVLSDIMHIKQQAAKLRSEAYRCRRQRVNEGTWRLSTENIVTSRFKAEVICRKCRKRFWEADFQAEQTEWAVAAEDLRERRAKRLPCSCSNEERMLVDIHDPGSSSLFAHRSDTPLQYHCEDRRLLEQGIPQRIPDLIIGLEHTASLKQLLPKSQSLKHSPFIDGHASYPFLLIEAKSEKGSPGFESVERQSAFPLRTLLKLQQDLQQVNQIFISPLVWFMANQGDEWRVYACVVDGTRYMLLIVDHICDWARDIFRPNVLRCLSGRDDVWRDETPASIYPECPPNADPSSDTVTLRSLQSITRRTHSLSLDPVSRDSQVTASVRLRSEESEDRSDITFNEPPHPYLRYSHSSVHLPPWGQFATIRHSDMIRFSFHILSIPEDTSQVRRVLGSLGEPNLGVHDTCSLLLQLMEDDQSVTVTMNAIYQLEAMWTDRPYSLNALADHPVRARVLFNTYISEDWQVVREIHCIVASRLALRALMLVTTGRHLVAPRGANFPDISVETEGVHSLRRLSGGYSVAAALSAAYLCLVTDASDSGETHSSWALRKVAEQNPLFDFEKKLAYKQACNPTSVKLEAISGSSSVPDEFGSLYGLTKNMDRTGAILIKKPLFWTSESPDFCLMVVDGTSFTDPVELGRKLSRVCEVQNIYITEPEKGKGAHPLSERDQIGILRWIEILSGRLPDDSPCFID